MIKMTIVIGISLATFTHEAHAERVVIADQKPIIDFINEKGGMDKVYEDNINSLYVSERCASFYYVMQTHITGKSKDAKDWKKKYTSFQTVLIWEASRRYKMFFKNNYFKKWLQIESSAHVDMYNAETEYFYNKNKDAISGPLASNDIRTCFDFGRIIASQSRSNSKQGYK